MPPILHSDAHFSECGSYRYLLTRRWEGGKGKLNIIGLNPSTADASHNDPTIRRCIDFAQRWGFAELAVTNLYAFRATKPRDLFQATDPEGPHNAAFLLETGQAAQKVLFAWGNHGHKHPRLDWLIERFPEAVCLGQTKIGAPRHPLYVRAVQVPELFGR